MEPTNFCSNFLQFVGFGRFICRFRPQVWPSKHSTPPTRDDFPSISWPYSFLSILLLRHFQMIFLVALVTMSRKPKLQLIFDAKCPGHVFVTCNSRSPNVSFLEKCGKTQYRFSSIFLDCPQLSSIVLICPQLSSIILCLPTASIFES